MQHEPKNKLSDVLPLDVRTIDHMAPVWEAMRQLKNHSFSSLIVDRKHIVHQVLANNLSFDCFNVCENMSELILIQHHGTDIRHTINIINRFKI